MRMLDCRIISSGGAHHHSTVDIHRGPAAHQNQLRRSKSTAFALSRPNGNSQPGEKITRIYLVFGAYPAKLILLEFSVKLPCCLTK